MRSLFIESFIVVYIDQDDNNNNNGEDPASVHDPSVNSSYLLGDSP